MNVVDSSAWLEYVAGSPLASAFSSVIEDIDNLIVPAITLYEVNKRLLVQKRELVAAEILTLMQEGKVVELTSALAVEASNQATKNGLNLADSIIYATAINFGATVWTCDADFKDLPNVRYFDKR